MSFFFSHTYAMYVCMDKKCDEGVQCATMYTKNKNICFNFNNSLKEQQQPEQNWSENAIFACFAWLAGADSSICGPHDKKVYILKSCAEAKITAKTRKLSAKLTIPTHIAYSIQYMCSNFRLFLVASIFLSSNIKSCYFFFCIHVVGTCSDSLAANSWSGAKPIDLARLYLARYKLQVF